MIRRFKFDQDVYETLDLVPMAVRRKLDRIGIKIGLEQWRALSRGERLATCHLPANLEEECEAMRLFLREAITRATGVEPKLIPEAERDTADPPAQPPARLIEHARAAGFALDETSWSKLDPDARYALMKMGGGKAVSHNFTTALEEFLGAQSEAATDTPVKS